MADVPEGATLVLNPVSTAPGFRIGNVIVMAGVPRIMQAMFDGLRHALVGGTPMLSRAIAVNVPEGKIAAGLDGAAGALRGARDRQLPVFPPGAGRHHHRAARLRAGADRRRGGGAQGPDGEPGRHADRGSQAAGRGLTRARRARLEGRTWTISCAGSSSPVGSPARRLYATCRPSTPQAASTAACARRASRSRWRRMMPRSRSASIGAALAAWGTVLRLTPVRGVDEWSSLDLASDGSPELHEAGLAHRGARRNRIGLAGLSDNDKQRVSARRASSSATMFPTSIVRRCPQGAALRDRRHRRHRRGKPAARAARSSSVTSSMSIAATSITSIATHRRPAHGCGRRRVLAQPRLPRRRRRVRPRVPGRVLLGRQAGACGRFRRRGPRVEDLWLFCQLCIDAIGVAASRSCRRFRRSRPTTRR